MSKHKKKRNENIWILDIKEDEYTGELFIEFPKELMEIAGWKPGDVLEWDKVSEEVFSLKKPI